MVFYYLRNYMSTGEAPDQMIDPNTKTDYNKMKRVLQLDRLDGDRKGVIKTIAERGEIIGNVEETFPARAEAPRVEAFRQGTELHKIIMQFEGWELKRMEEV